jgi:hypothetical protein
MFFIAVWAVVGASILLQAGMVRGAGEIRNATRQVTGMQDFHQAEAVLDQVLRNVQTHATNKCPSTASPFPNVCLATNMGPNPQDATIWRIRVISPPTSHRMLEVTAIEPIAALQTSAAFGVTKIKLQTSAGIEGYAGGPTIIQTNGTSTQAGAEAIEFNTSAHLYGNAVVPNPYSTVAITAGSYITQGATGSIGGGVTCGSGASAGRCDDVTPPPAPAAVPANPAVANTNPMLISVCDTDPDRTLNYCVPGATCNAPYVAFPFTTLNTPTNCTVNFSGDATQVSTLALYSINTGSSNTLSFGGGDVKVTTSSTSTTDFALGTGNTLGIVPGKNVTIIANGNILIRNGALINTTGSTYKNFQLKASGNRTIDIGNTTDFRGLVYNPQGTVLVSGSTNVALKTTMRGAIIADQVTIATNSLLLTDAEQTNSTENLVEFDLLAWREIECLDVCTLS